MNENNASFTANILKCLIFIEYLLCLGWNGVIFSNFYFVYQMPLNNRNSEYDAILTQSKINILFS